MMRTNQRYLTKSRFKLALECVTKLFYTRNKQYEDQTNDDPFMQALAKGGYQIGELAKYKYCNDPIAENITISTLNEEEALRLTAEKMLQANVVIAEAAFLYDNLFVRVDLLVKTNNQIKLIEVKSKSYSAKDSFISSKNTPVSKWVPYLYDLAFQTYVVRQALQNQSLTIVPYFLLVNKDEVVPVDSLNQVFKISNSYVNGYNIKTDLSSIHISVLNDIQILKEINMSDEIETILNMDVVAKNIPYEYRKFEDFVNWCSEIYKNETRVFTDPGSKCKKCQFKASPNSELKCGMSECWSNADWETIGKTKIDVQTDRLKTELWMGKAGPKLPGEMEQHKVPFLDDIQVDWITPANEKNDLSSPGMSPFERRKYQIQLNKKNEPPYVFWKTEFEELRQSEWGYPYHMIDFETTTVAIPYFKGMHPFETIAFQFSHHILHENGHIEHFNQWLSFEPNEYPNINFLNALKDSLSDQAGTIFMYANHENAVLRKLRKDVESLNPENKEELIEFIDDLTSVRTSAKNKLRGKRCMVDLAEIVKSFYYSSHARGSNSIKKILPAIIHDCPELVAKYSRPDLYGMGKTYNSLNFEDHVWLTSESGYDPYKTLPTIFSENEINQFGKPEDDDFDEVSDGAAAMLAYDKLQYDSRLLLISRFAYKKALLRYCELDTLSMAILMEGLGKLDEKK
jgi:hypothetical protein